MIERAVEFSAADIYTGGAIMLVEAVKPVARAIERAAKIEQESINGGHATKSLSAQRSALKWQCVIMLRHCGASMHEGLTSP